MHAQGAPDESGLRQLLISLGEAMAPQIGEDFLGSLVEKLARLVGVRTVLIGECVGPARERVRTLAIWDRDLPAENIEYPLKGSPCARVVDGCAPYHCETGLGEIFPHEGGVADSYYGEPIFSRDAREVIGHIALLDVRPLGRDRMENALIAVFAARAGAEIERLRAENALHRDLISVAHGNRLAAMSEMITSLTHELKQPLTSTLAFARACANGLRLGTLSAEQMSSAMDRIVSNVDMADHIIRQMGDFLRREAPESSAEALVDLVHGALALVRHDLASRRVVATFRADTSPVVRVNRVQIQQILVNLIRNAAEAVESVDEGEGRIDLRLEEGGPEVSVAIVDNGPGVPDSVREHLFEPFHSTKPRGMGVGLAISRTIAERHGGRLVCLDRASGAEFVLSLPVADATTPD